MLSPLESNKLPKILTLLTKLSANQKEGIHKKEIPGEKVFTARPLLLIEGSYPVRVNSSLFNLMS